MSLRPNVSNPTKACAWCTCEYISICPFWLRRILLWGSLPPPPSKTEEASRERFSSSNLLHVSGVPVRDGIPLVSHVFSVHHSLSLNFSTVITQLEWRSPQPLVMTSHCMIYSPSGLSFPGSMSTLGKNKSLISFFFFSYFLTKLPLLRAVSHHCGDD